MRCRVVVYIAVLFGFAQPPPTLAEPATEQVVESAPEFLSAHTPKTLTLILDRITPDLDLTPNWVNAMTGFIPAGTGVEVFAISADGVKPIPLQRHHAGILPAENIAAFQFTHIGSALLKLAKRFPADDKTEHHIIVINGGLGQTSDSFNEFRIALLQEHLSKANVIVHTVCVDSSSNCEQLAALSAMTDGWYEETRSAKGMTRAALRLITGLTTPNLAPIADSLFRIAPETKTLNLVLFQQDPTLPASLTSPKLATFSQFNAPPNIVWMTTGELAIIHIPNPDAGTWHLDTPPDSDHRAIVDHPLRIVTKSIPRNVLQNRSMQVEIRLANGDHQVTPKSTMEPIQMRVRLLSRGQEIQSWYPRDNGNYPDLEADDGITTVDFAQGLPAGIYRLVIDAETSEWQRQLSILIHSQEYPITLHHELTTNGKLGTLIVTPRVGLLNATTVVLDTLLNVAGHELQSIPLTQIAPLVWQLDLDAVANHQPDAAELSVAASNNYGDSISAWIDLLPFVKPAPSTDEPGEPRKTASPFGTNKLTEEHRANEAETGSVRRARAWLRLVSQVGAINSAITVIFGLGYWRWRRANQRWMNEIRGTLAYD